MNIPETRYAPTPDGGYIAYKSIGDGPIDLAYIGGMATTDRGDVGVRAVCTLLARSRILGSADRARP